MATNVREAPTLVERFDFLGPGFDLEGVVQERIFGGDLFIIREPAGSEAWIASEEPVEVRR